MHNLDASVINEFITEDELLIALPRIEKPRR